MVSDPSTHANYAFGGCMNDYPNNLTHIQINCRRLSRITLALPFCGALRSCHSSEWTAPTPREPQRLNMDLWAGWFINGGFSSHSILDDSWKDLIWRAGRTAIDIINSELSQSSCYRWMDPTSANTIPAAGEVSERHLLGWGDWNPPMSLGIGQIRRVESRVSSGCIPHFLLLKSIFPLVQCGFKQTHSEIPKLMLDRERTAFSSRLPSGFFTGLLRNIWQIALNSFNR